MKIKLSILSVAFAVLTAVGTYAASYNLTGSTTGSAGGPMESASYSIDSTLGQPTPIGESEGLDYVLKAGFWYAPLRLPGDATGDCKVTISDLIFVRNNLNQPLTGDNWRADVNEDEVIDILDLVFVRNRLGDECPE